jgi:hypothetical protein
MTSKGYPINWPNPVHSPLGSLEKYNQNKPPIINRITPDSFTCPILAPVETILNTNMLNPMNNKTGIEKIISK